MTWKKYPAESIKVPADWNDLIPVGDSIASISVAINGVSASLSVTILSTANKVSIVQMIGGTAKTRVNLVFTINTVGGDLYTPVKTLVMLSPNDPSWA